MITFHIISIFPESFKSYLNTSILGRAQKKKLIKIKIYDIRDFAKDKHKTVDDKAYGGGPGMVLKAEPIAKAIASVISNSKFLISSAKGGSASGGKQIPKSKFKKSRLKIILLSPGGKQFNQKIARDLAKKYKNIILICGHYEGIDARLKSVLRVTGYALQDLSIGPYILSSGELAAMVIIDAISRHIPGVLGKIESLEEKKGSYPVYTRPEIFVFKGKKYRVPKVLLTGDHKKISEWRKKYGKMK
jgi:tRNA (guanine37-N1)-methyltransferase